jgi:hypothetical protein
VRGSGSGFPGNIGSGQGFSSPAGELCTDGSYGNAYSAALTFKNGPLTLVGAYELHEAVNRTGDDGSMAPVGAGPGAVVLPDGSVVITGIHNEWAAKVGAGYRFHDWLGDLQVYGIAERIQRDGAVPAFNERSRDAAFASITQFIGPWSLSASYTHAFASPGNPATLSPNDPSAYGPPLGPGAVYQANLFSDAADQVAAGVKYRFSQWASAYLVASYLKNQAGGHYCLGASGMAFQFCSRDQFNDTIGGAAIKAVSTGLTLDF